MLPFSSDGNVGHGLWIEILDYETKKY